MAKLATAPPQTEHVRLLHPRDAQALRTQQPYDVPVRTIHVQPARKRQRQEPAAATLQPTMSRSSSSSSTSTIKTKSTPPSSLTSMTHLDTVSTIRPASDGDDAKMDTRSSFRPQRTTTTCTHPQPQFGVHEDVDEKKLSHEGSGSGSGSRTQERNSHDIVSNMSAPEINLQVDAFASNLVPEDFEAVIQDFEAKQAALNQACAKRSVRDVEINYTDKDAACRKRYVGAVRNGKPHGRGTLTWTCGGDYSGDFRNDKLTGFGIHTWKNGKRYVGQWLDGKACGYGVLISSNGSMTYRGTWQDGLMHGFGRYNVENGDWYEGFWKLNNKDGLGVYQWANGDRYEGEFANQQHHGRGIYMWPNGRKLTTTFVKHVPLHAWTLARFLWMCMTFFSVCYVAFHVLDMLVRSIDETLMHYDVPAWVTSFRHHFLGPAPYDLFTAVSAPHTASVHEEEKEMDFLVQPEERMPTSDSFAANEVLDDSVPESSNSTWVYEMLRHELALPHIRIMLLLTLRPTLEEIFANIIANVACAWCHAQKLPISDDVSWHLGLALGCGSVLFFASLHILLYAFVM